MTKQTDFKKIKPENFYSHVSNENSSPELMHHIGTHPETDAYDLQRISAHPNSSPETLKHIHSLVTAPEVEGESPRLDRWDKKAISRNLYSHENTPKELVHDAHDKLDKESFLDQGYHHISFNKNLPISKITDSFKRHSEDFKLDGHSDDDAVKEYGMHPEVTPEHLEPFFNHEDVRIKEAAAYSPKASFEQMKKFFSDPEIDHDTKSEIISGRDHHSPELIQHLHDSLKSEMTKIKEDAEAKDETKKLDYWSHPYRKAHSVLESAIKHPNCPPELMEHYSKSENNALKAAAVYNPKFPHDKLQEMAKAGDAYARGAIWDRPEDIHHDTIRTLHGMIKPDKSKYGSNQQNSLIKHKDTPDDVLKERAGIGAYAAQKVLERKELSEDVLKHLVDHKTKSVALQALKHPSVTKGVVEHALNRKMKDVNQAASLHELAPKESKYEKFLKDESTARTGWEKGLHDDPEFVRQVKEKFHHDEPTAMLLLANKHINSADFNNLMEKFKGKEQAAKEDPSNAGVHFYNRGLFNSSGHSILGNQENMDSVGRQHFMDFFPHLSSQLENLTPDEMKAGLEKHSSIDQSKATSMASDFFHHDNLSSEVAKDIIVGKYGKIEPQTYSGYGRSGDKIKDTVHNRPEVFTPEVIREGLLARPEFANPNIVEALASSPHFTPDHADWDHILSEIEPAMGDDDRDKNLRYNSVLKGMYQNPNIGREHIKNALKSDEWYTEALNNPALEDDDLLEYINSKPEDGSEGNAYKSRHREELAQALVSKEIAHKALSTTNDPHLANTIHRNTRDLAKFYDKHISTVVKNPNPDVVKQVLADLPSYGTDHKKISKAADSLFKHPDSGVRSAAFRFMSDDKKNDYIEKFGKTDPSIIRGLDPEKLSAIDIDKNTPYEAVEAIVDHHAATPEHHKAAFDHSPEGALRVIRHQTNRFESTPYLERLPRSGSAARKEKIRASNKEKLDRHKAEQETAMQFMDKAIERHHGHDDIMNTIYEKSNRSGEKGDHYVKTILNHDGVSDRVKARIIKDSNGRGLVTPYLNNFKDTESKDIALAMAECDYIPQDIISHMAKRSTPETARALAYNRNIGRDEEAVKALLAHGNDEVGLSLSNNPSVSDEIKNELFKNPYILLNTRGRGATDEHLDRVLEDHAPKNPQFYADVAIHPSSTDDLRSKVVKLAAKRMSEIKAEHESSGTDYKKHQEYGHLNLAFQTAVSNLKSRKLHGEAQQLLAEHADHSTVRDYLRMNQGRAIDDKAAEKMHQNWHDGIRGGFVEELLSTRFKNQNLSHTLLDEAGQAGNFDSMATHITLNKLSDEAYQTAYSHLKNSQEGDSPRAKALLLSQLVQKGHEAITSELLAAHPDMVYYASKNKRLNPEHFRNAFHSAIQNIAQGNSTSVPRDGFGEILSNPHISGDDIAKAYRAIDTNPHEMNSVYLKNAMAENHKTSPELLTEMATAHANEDFKFNSLANKNLPREVLKTALIDAVKDVNNHKYNQALGSIAENPNTRLSDFEEAIEHHYPYGSFPSDNNPTDNLKEAFVNKLTESPHAHPEDLHKIYEEESKKEVGRYSRRNSALSNLLENPNTSKETLMKALADGKAQENDLIEHPTIGGDIFRAREHKFPTDVSGIQTGNEINKAVYKPKQEKYQAVINMLPEEGMDWATFKKAEPKLAGDPDVQKMFTSQPKQKLFKPNGEKYLEDLPGNTFHISYRNWTGMQRHDGGNTTQLCMQINNSAEQEAELKKDPRLFKLYKFAQKTSNGSGHPVTPHTIAWSRIDTSDPEHWFIDEAQSDMNSSLSKILKEVSETGQSRAMKDKFGLDPEEAEALLPKLQGTIKNWEKAAFNSIIELAKKHGVKRVSAQSGDLKTKMNKSPGSEVTNKYNKIYNETTNAVGFTEKIPYSTLKNHNPKYANEHIWSMDLTGKDDVKKHEFTPIVRKSKKDILESLIKFEIGQDGQLVQPKKGRPAPDVARMRMKHYSRQHGLDTSFVDRLLGNNKRKD